MVGGEKSMAVGFGHGFMGQFPVHHIDGAGERRLADLERLDSISLDCAPEIGKVMELCDQKGVALVVRVIPDHTKDIGLGILSHFHYHRLPRIVTCANMAEAAKLLSFTSAAS